MPNRNFSVSSYRYGFNGKENDPETNTQDYGFRVYNPALGKFLSVDPLTKQYPELTPYQFASNRPLDGIDLDGLENRTYLYSIVIQNGKALIKNSSVIDYVGFKGTEHGPEGGGFDKVILAYGNGVFTEYYLVGSTQTFSKEERDKLVEYNGVLSAAISISLEQAHQDAFMGSLEADVNSSVIDGPENDINPETAPVVNVSASANSGVKANGVKANPTQKKLPDPTEQEINNFNITNVNKVGGNMNCVSCAIATDNLLKGNPSSARNVLTMKEQRNGVSLTILEKEYKTNFKYGFSIDGIKKELSQPGTRAIIFGNKGAGVPGHVFNAKNQGGSVNFMDGQTGKAANTSGYQNFGYIITNKK